MNNVIQERNLLKNTPLVTITAEALKRIFETIGKYKAETGGVLGGTGDAYEVLHYHFDISSSNSAATYSPDHQTLNDLFDTDWNPNDIRLRGFVHSHPGRMNRPSYGDERYARRILKAIDDLECLLLPIVNTIPDTGKFKLTPWVAYPARRGVKVVRAKIQVLGEAVENSEVSELLNKVLDEIVLSKEAFSPLETKVIDLNEARIKKYSKIEVDVTPSSKEDENSAEEQSKDTDYNQTFNRVTEAYDLDIMRTSRIICVGAGGAASFIEELARAGVGQFVLIDPDVVSETNIATQQVYRKDIGKYKVNCIAERIQDINKQAKVITLQKYLDDLSDERVEHYATGIIDGYISDRTIICGLTDNFEAQARVNRLALQLGIPSLNAQVYKEGRAAEITFTYPGITPACNRCILSSRYNYFLNQKNENPVTSHGTPIFATTRLNSIKGFLILAMLHHGTDHPRWGNVLKRIGNRNLIQIRMEPDLGETLGLSVFDKVFENADKARLFFDETIWLPQDQECPATGYAYCPDCGGTGNLYKAVRKFEDTRVMPLEAETTTKIAVNQ